MGVFTHFRQVDDDCAYLWYSALGYAKILI